jgi:tetratricopeptide (TPR) repeat protein
MAGDPLKEVLQKVAAERRTQLEGLSSQLKSTFDPVVRDGLEKQISQLQAELAATEQALLQPVGDAQPVAAPHHLVPPVTEVRPAADPQLLESEGDIPAAKSPSKAALEAQIRELQTQLLDAARAVEKGGASPNAMDIAHLKQIREKLQNAMQQIGTIGAGVHVGDLPPRPTPSQIADADNLIKRSLLEKRRGNNREAGDLLRLAADVAPGSPSVLEALGDDIMERGQAKPAAEIYAKALRIQPNNAGIERKYAMAVARSKGTLSIEEALNASLGDSPLSAADAANARIAAILSFFIPGGGQIILGDYVKGLAFFFTWVVLLIWISVAKGQWQALVDSIAGKTAGFNPTILIPVVGVLALGIAAAFTCKKGGGPGGPGGPEVPKKGKGPRPKPPVDLPFE